MIGGTWSTLAGDQTHLGASRTGMCMNVKTDVAVAHLHAPCLEAELCWWQPGRLENCSGGSLEPPGPWGGGGVLKKGGSSVRDLDFGHFRVKKIEKDFSSKGGPMFALLTLHDVLIPEVPYFFFVFLVPDRFHATRWPGNG